MHSGPRCRIYTALQRTVRADDEEMIPLVRLPRTRHFTDTEQARLGKPSVQLGGKTIGEELSLIRKQYLEAEARAARSEEHLHDTNWQGDVYVGSRWNELSVLYLIFLLTPLVGLLCAWLSYGVYWGITPGLYGAPF